jgi:hypothetical protein
MLAITVLLLLSCEQAGRDHKRFRVGRREVELNRLLLVVAGDEEDIGQPLMTRTFFEHQ